MAAELVKAGAADPMTGRIARQRVFVLGGSTRMEFIRVVEDHGGRVWTQGYRRPGHETLGGGRWTQPERLYREFVAEVAVRREFERRGGYLTEERDTADGLF